MDGIERKEIKKKILKWLLDKLINSEFTDFYLYENKYIDIFCEIFGFKESLEIFYECLEELKEKKILFHTIMDSSVGIYDLSMEKIHFLKKELEKLKD